MEEFEVKTKEDVRRVIRMIRAYHHLTQKEFGAKVGTSVMAVSHWERKGMCSVQNLLGISRVFGVRITINA